MTEKKHKFSGEPEYEGECDPFVHRVAEKPNSWVYKRKLYILRTC